MKGILLKEQLFKKTIEGLKTETRRKVHFNEVDEKYLSTPPFTEIEIVPRDCPTGFQLFANNPFDPASKDPITRWVYQWDVKPRYKVGEVVYIKEPVAAFPQKPLIYKYDTPKQHRKNFKWSNKLFMKAVDARYHIKIVGVTAERICDISVDSVEAEGLDNSFPCADMDYYIEKILKELPMDEEYLAPQQQFFYLFKTINPHTDLKSWVWVYQYELIKFEG